MALDGLLIIQIVDLFSAKFAACSKDLKHEDRLHSQASNDVIRAATELNSMKIKAYKDK